MGIYFLIAIALSAMSAATEVQVSRPCLAQVQRVRAERRAIRNVRQLRDKRVGQTFVSGRPDRNVRPTPCLNHSPRAPAFGC
jgi:hypothetical protein